MKKSTLSALLHTKAAKLIPILVITGLMATASASVFVYYYGSTTATVRAADIMLYAGSDSTSSPTVYPAATVTPSSTNDYVTITISLFRSATNSPQPATYFTNLTVIRNNANSHSISLVSISDISTTGSPFGKISVYYRSSQNDDPTSVSGLIGSQDITSTTGGNVYSGTDSLSADNRRFIEIIAYAGLTASTGDTISLRVNIQWS